MTLFCIGQLLLVMGPALKCDWYTQWNFIGENRFLLCQWVLAADNFLVMGRSLTMSIPHSRCWNSVCVEYYAGSGSAATVFLSPYVHQFCCIWKPPFISSSSSMVYGFCNLFISSSMCILHPRGESLDKDIPFKAKHFHIIILSTLASCKCLNWMLPSAKNYLPWPTLRAPQV